MNHDHDDHDEHDHHDPAGHDAHGGHGGHGGHGDHVAMFRTRFWWSLLLAAPVVGFSHMFGDLLGYDLPSGTAHNNSSRSRRSGCAAPARRMPDTAA